MDVVELQEVRRMFGRVAALRDVSLTVPGGQFVAVMGATGSGKSTLLHCAAGLDRPTAGRVRLAGRDVTRMREAKLTRLRRDQVGFVFQSYNLLSELTVRQNVALPGRLGGPRPRRVEDVLATVGLDGMGSRPVGELSGGQRQRVAIARALITGPAVIFADEPTGALDPTTGDQVLGLLRAAVDADGVTVVMVTHDPGSAAWSDRLVLLRDGMIAADLPTPGREEIAERLRAVTLGVDASAARSRAGVSSARPGLGASGSSPIRRDGSAESAVLA